MNIVLIGFMGTGKSVVGRRLARKLGWRFVDADTEIERRSGKPIPLIFKTDGEAAFRDLEHGVLKELAAGSRQVIATGGGAYTFERNREALDAAGVVVCLAATPEVIYERVKRRLDRRPLLAASKNPLEEIRAMLAARQPHYAKAAVAVDGSGLSVEAQVESVYRAVQPFLENA